MIKEKYGCVEKLQKKRTGEEGRSGVRKRKRLLQMKKKPNRWWREQKRGLVWQIK